jgi:pimeloyl-ACP methyl ester carboxylesterase
MKSLTGFYLLFMVTVASGQNNGYVYPLKHHSFYSQQQKLTMAYIYEKAQNENGKTILLLHGKNFSGTYWSQTIKLLLDNGFNVLVPDQIGFGTSDMPQRYQYSFQQLAVNTKSLADSLHILKLIVLGHSMGGMLAVRFALQYPESCSQLILENPIGLEDWKIWVPYSSVDNEYKKEMTKTQASLRKYMLENYFHGQWKTEYDSLLYYSSRNLGNASAAWSMALTSDMIFTQPVCYEFSSIKTATVLMIGQLDRTAIGKERVDSVTAANMGNYPMLGRKVASLIPGCRLIELNGIGHIPHIEDFKSFSTKLLEALR